MAYIVGAVAIIMLVRGKMGICSAAYAMATAHSSPTKEVSRQVAGWEKLTIRRQVIEIVLLGNFDFKPPEIAIFPTVFVVFQKYFQKCLVD